MALPTTKNVNTDLDINVTADALSGWFAANSTGILPDAIADITEYTITTATVETIITSGKSFVGFSDSALQFTTYVAPPAANVRYIEDKTNPTGPPYKNPGASKYPGWRLPIPKAIYATIATARIIQRTF